MRHLQAAPGRTQLKGLCAAYQKGGIERVRSGGADTRGPAGIFPVTETIHATRTSASEYRSHVASLPLDHALTQGHHP